MIRPPTRSPFNPILSAKDIPYDATLVFNAPPAMSRTLLK